MENENYSEIPADTKKFLNQKRKSKFYQTKKREVKRFIDLSNGQEHNQILFPVIYKSKLLKTNFDNKSNYILKSFIKNRPIDEYILPKEYSCTCKGKCNKNFCDCIQNHIQRYECNSNCDCDVNNCENRIIQKGITKKLKVDYINNTKGFGLFTRENISKGEFVCEYVGQIISKEAATEKIHSNFMKKKANYVLQIRENYENMTINTYIDAEENGNVSRFLNHSCEPNLYFDIIRVEHFIPQVAFFAIRDIKENEELSFLYCEMVVYNCEVSELGSYKKCECGALNCKKYLPS